MFKPSLKRSKLEPNIPYNHTNTYTHKTFSAKTSFQVKQPIQMEKTTSIIIAKQLIEPLELVDNKNYSHIFNPLACTYFEYPLSVTKLLHDAEAIKKRGIGTFKSIYWFFADNSLIIWKEEKSFSRQYSLEGKIEAIAVGQFKNVGLHFKRNEVTIIAIAIENKVFLYSLNPDNLEITDLKLHYRMKNTFSVQKIKFLNQQQLIFGGDTGIINLVTFGDQLVIQTVKVPFFQTLLPPSNFWLNNQQRYLQNIITNKHMIYCLIRKEKENNWLTIKTKNLFNSIIPNSGKRDQYISEQRFIQVYQINEEKKEIVLRFTFSERQIQNRIRNNYYNFKGQNMIDAFKIKSIYLDRSQHKEGRLALVTKCGYIAILKDNQQIYLEGQPLQIPKQTGEAGFLIEKNIKSKQIETVNRYNEVISSLGYENITLMNESIVYFGKDSLNVIKCDKIYGDLYEKQPNNEIGVSYQRQWAIFSKTGYYLINKLQIRQVLLLYIYFRSEILQEENQKSFDHDFAFQIAIDNLSKSLGYTRMCQILLEILIAGKQESFTINQRFYSEFIRDQLKGLSNPDYQEWNHSVEARSSSKKITPTDKMLKFVWGLLLQYQFKRPREMLKNSLINSKQCSSYWYALQNMFYIAIAPILKLEAKNCKKQHSKIETSMKMLNKICKIIESKKEIEKKIRKQTIKEITVEMLYEESDVVYQKSIKKQQFGSLKKQDLGSTMDNSNNLYQSHNFINESVLTLEVAIVESIPKIKVLLKLFSRLMEAECCENVPPFENILTILQDQLLLKEFIFKLIDSQSIIEEISHIIPQLQLGKELQYKKWLKLLQSNEIHPDSINQNQLALFINSSHLKQLNTVFAKHLDSYVIILMCFMKNSEEQMRRNAKRLSIEQRSIIPYGIFFKDEVESNEQKKKYLMKELHAFENQIKTVLSAVVEQYNQSDQHHFHRLDQQIDHIVHSIAASADPSLIQYFQLELKQYRILEKVLALKKCFKKTQPQLVSQQQFNIEIKKRQLKPSLEYFKTKKLE